MATTVSNVELPQREMTDVRQRPFVSSLIGFCLLPFQGQESYTAALVTMLLKTVQSMINSCCLLTTLENLM